MPHSGGLTEKLFSLGVVLRHALAQPVSLAKVEDRIAVALGGPGLPLLDRSGKIAAGPGVHPGLGIGLRGLAEAQSGSERQRGKQKVATHRKIPVPRGGLRLVPGLLPARSPAALSGR